MLPHTTPQHYITGKTALNIPSKEGTGDWHFQESFYGRGNLKPKISLAGEGEPLDTNPILADFGIYECSSTLREWGLPISDEEKVYAANHYRAMLDMLYRCAKKNIYPHHLDIDEWFNTPEEISFLLEAINRMEAKLPNTERQVIEKWIAQQT